MGVEHPLPLNVYFRPSHKQGYALHTKLYHILPLSIIHPCDSIQLYINLLLNQLCFPLEVLQYLQNHQLLQCEVASYYSNQPRLKICLKKLHQINPKTYKCYISSLLYQSLNCGKLKKLNILNYKVFSLQKYKVFQMSRK